MSRNTDDRLGGLPSSPESAEAPPVATQASDSTGFNWAVPTEFVTLPTRGRFYPADHPLHNQETVEIRYMTAKEEDILTSRSLLKEGVALDRLLQNILVDKSININTLLVGDKNALIVAARVTGYGADYETKVTCPSCTATEDYEFDLTDGKIVDMEDALREYNATLTPDNTLIVELPLSKVKVECRLMTGADENKMIKEAQRKTKRKIDEAALTDQFKLFIVSVNGDRDPMSVLTFSKSMPARDSRYLRNFYGDAVPNFDLSQTFECSSCGYSADMEVPLTPDFFWPKR